MAGAGSRFMNAGYTIPKPLIEILGTPMIRIVINNIMPSRVHRFIFICLKKHVDDYDLNSKLLSWAPGSLVIELDGLTEGAACTMLAARDIINVDDPIMIANSDQYVDIDIDEYLYHADNFDGHIMTMHASHPKWSYVKLDNNGLVQYTREKEVISDEATVGIYNFKKGRDFVKGVDDMIAKQLRVNGEYFIAPVYNELIEQGKSVGIYNIGEVDNGMYGLGTPEDLDRFLNLPISRKAANC